MFWKTAFRQAIVIVALITLIITVPGVAITHAQDGGITIGTTDFPRTLDPAVASDLPSIELLTQLYTGLVRQVPGTLDFELALATDHTLSDDGLTHTFAVDADAAFADGTPITAQTFVDSINRVIALDRDGAALITPYIQEVRAGENNTVIFTLTVPIPEFEAFLALPPFFPQHPDGFPAGEPLDENTLQSYIGNGPYRLESFRPGQEAVLTPDPNYTGGTPATAPITLRGYALPIDLREALIAHEIDIAWRALTPADLDAVEAAGEITITTQPNLQTFYLLLNHTPTTLETVQSFDDPAVRQALALLTDRPRIAERGFADAVLPLYTILPAQFGSDTAFPQYNMELADAVLQEAGYRPRRRTIQIALYLSTDTYGNTHGAGINELRRGVEESEIVDIGNLVNDRTDTFTRAVYRGEFAAAVIGWRPPFATAAGYLVPLAHSAMRIPQSAMYTDEAIDDLLTAAALAADDDERMALYADIEQRLLENFAFIPLWQAQDDIAYWPEVEGVTIAANSLLDYTTLSR